MFAGTGLLAAFAGSAVNRLLPESVTLAGFAFVMVAAGVRILSRTEGSGIDMSVAVGTSLVIVAANSGSGLVAYLGDLSPDWGIVAAFTVTAIGGSIVAGRYGKNIDTPRLQKWFVYLIFAVAALVLVQVTFLR